ncbi:MAG: hypothetical protein AAFS01_14465 [Pseudomonadota bacterium]
MVLIPVAGAIASLAEEDWTWFARSGSGLVATSIWMFSIAYYSDSLVAVQSLLKKGPEESKGAREAFERLQQSANHYSIAAAGAIVGSLNWGYGDLVGKLF